MSASDYSEFRRGRVVHVRPCPEQCQDGHFISCHHGSNCDCPGEEFDCATCDGTGEVLDEDCICPGCVRLFTRNETIRHANH